MQQSIIMLNYGCSYDMIKETTRYNTKSFQRKQVALTSARGENIELSKYRLFRRDKRINEINSKQ